MDFWSAFMLVFGCIVIFSLAQSFRGLKRAYTDRQRSIQLQEETNQLLRELISVAKDRKP
jgi:hypothetical protein